MKCVIAAVNAKYIHSNLAVYCLKAYAKKHGEEVELKEYTINQSKDEILRGLYKSLPDFLCHRSNASMTQKMLRGDCTAAERSMLPKQPAAGGESCKQDSILCFSCYIWNISLVKEIVRELHKILPELPIWLGGPEVSYDAKRVLAEEPAVTGVLCGEGEVTFLELLQQYRSGEKNFSKIKGLAWRDEDGEIRENPWREIMPLDEVPFPYSDLREFENRIIYYESSRGCPFSCSYCLSSVDKKLRFRSLELVLPELQFFLDQKVPQVKFVDRTFNCRHEHAQAIWRYLLEHDNGITNFHFEISADLINEEELEIFRQMRPGLIQLEIGVQSTNPETIRAIHRTMNFEKVAETVKKVQQNRNIHQHLDLIAGLPFEDFASFRKSFADVYALHPQQLQLGFLKVLKGSYMQEHTEDYECRYQETEPYEVLTTKWLSYDDVLQLKLVEEMVEVYCNSGQFYYLLAQIEKSYENMFDFFLELGSFYEEKGYWGLSHNRIRRYEILLEFLQEKIPQKAEQYRQLAVLDIYARENSKSRPGFARDLSSYKDEFREFYQVEENERKYLTDYEGCDWKQLQRMTHIEVVQDFETGQERRILFDYKRRDALTGSAWITEIQ